MSLIRQSSKDTTKVLRVRVPAALSDRLDAIEKRAREAGLVFALTDALSESLEKLAAKAERELDAHGKHGAAGDTKS